MSKLRKKFHENLYPERSSKVDDCNVSRERKRNGVVRIYINGGGRIFWGELISDVETFSYDLADFV